MSRPSSVDPNIYYILSEAIHSSMDGPRAQRGYPLATLDRVTADFKVLETTGPPLSKAQYGQRTLSCKKVNQSLFNK